MQSYSPFSDSDGETPRRHSAARLRLSLRDSDDISSDEDSDPFVIRSYDASLEDYERDATKQVACMLERLESKLYRDGVGDSRAAPSPLAKSPVGRAFNLERRHNFETHNRPQVSHMKVQLHEWTKRFPFFRIRGMSATVSPGGPTSPSALDSKLKKPSSAMSNHSAGSWAASPPLSPSMARVVSGVSPSTVGGPVSHRSTSTDGEGKPVRLAPPTPPSHAIARPASSLADTIGSVLPWAGSFVDGCGGLMVVGKRETPAPPPPMSPDSEVVLAAHGEHCEVIAAMGGVEAPLVGDCRRGAGATTTSSLCCLDDVLGLCDGSAPCGHLPDSALRAGDVVQAPVPPPAADPLAVLPPREAVTQEVAGVVFDALWWAMAPLLQPAVKTLVHEVIDDMEAGGGVPCATHPMPGVTEGVESDSESSDSGFHQQATTSLQAPSPPPVVKPAVSKLVRVPSPPADRTIPRQRPQHRGMVRHGGGRPWPTSPSAGGTLWEAAAADGAPAPPLHPSAMGLDVVPLTAHPARTQSDLMLHRGRAGAQPSIQRRSSSLRGAGIAVSPRQVMPYSAQPARAEQPSNASATLPLQSAAVAEVMSRPRVGSTRVRPRSRRRTWRTPSDHMTEDVPLVQGLGYAAPIAPRPRGSSNAAPRIWGQGDGGEAATFSSAVLPGTHTRGRSMVVGSSRGGTKSRSPAHSLERGHNRTAFTPTTVVMNMDGSPSPMPGPSDASGLYSLSRRPPKVGTDTSAALLRAAAPAEMARAQTAVPRLRHYESSPAASGRMPAYTPMELPSAPLRLSPRTMMHRAGGGALPEPKPVHSVEAAKSPRSLRVSGDAASSLTRPVRQGPQRWYLSGKATQDARLWVPQTSFAASLTVPPVKPSRARAGGAM